MFKNNAHLAQKLDLKEEQVKLWFKGRRNQNISNDDKEIRANKDSIEVSQLDKTNRREKYPDVQKQEILEKEYLSNPYLDQTEISNLAQKWREN